MSTYEPSPLGKRPRRLALVGLLSLLAACDDCVEPINVIPPRPDQVDVFEQRDGARVDILWMVDNSPTMVSEQDKIADRVTEFFRSLVDSNVQYHMGFVTSDPDEGGRLRQYTGDPVQGCNGCRYISNATPCENPNVPTEGRSDAEIDADLLAECPAQYLFRQLVRTGTEGAVFEEPFRTVAMALGAEVIDPDTGRPTGEAPEENEGFLREDASLFIVFVSDEDESARADGVPVVYYQRLYESLKGRGNENKVKVSTITGWPYEDDLPAVEELCGILQTTYDKNPGTDDPRAAQVKEVIAASDTGCSDQADDPTDLHPYSETGGRFIDLVCRTRGVVANICSEDYSEVLKDLGANAAGLTRRFPISRADDIEAGTDCVLFTDDDVPHVLDCDGNGRFDDEVDGILCVSARPLGSEPGTEELLPGPAGDTWTWDAPTRSIRFDGTFLPAPGSTVTLRYRLRGDGRQPCP